MFRSKKSKLFLALAVLLSVGIISCKKEEETPVTTTPENTVPDTSTSTTGGATNTTDTTTAGGTNTAGGTTIPASTSEYKFSDDGITCTPYSSNPKISGQGILSVISNPCQSSSAKLDGYFKLGSRPAAGTYTIHNAGTNIDITGVDATSFQMIFYSHDLKDWFATAGSVTLTTNSSDASKLDMTWKDVEMTSADSSSVKFSGTLIGL